MEIIVQLNLDSINGAIKKVKEYGETMKPKLDKFMQKLAEFGLTELNCNLAVADYDGPSATQTYIEWTPEGFNLCASGATIAFIEFGTGVYYNKGGIRNYKGNIPAGVVDIGEYGHKQGRKNGWFYGKRQYTHGNKANAVLYDAGEAMRRDIERIAREVFASD